jgi:hypothetical protein
MLGLGEIDALERQLRASVVALNKKGVSDVTLVEAIDEAVLWSGNFEDLIPFVPSADNFFHRQSDVVNASRLVDLHSVSRRKSYCPPLVTHFPDSSSASFNLECQPQPNGSGYLGRITLIFRHGELRGGRRN